jgi:hypothetical protein
MDNAPKHSKHNTKNVIKHDKGDKKYSGGSGGGSGSSSSSSSSSGGGGGGGGGSGGEKEKGKEGVEIKNDVAVHHIPTHHKHPHTRTHTNSTHTNNTHTSMRNMQSTEANTGTFHLRSLSYNEHKKKHENKNENKNENIIRNVNSSNYSNGTFINSTAELSPNASTYNFMTESTYQFNMKNINITTQHKNRVFMWHKNTEMTQFDKRIQSAAQLNYIKVITEEMDGTV